MKWLVLLFLITSCATTPKDRFANILPGMDKSAVLEELGSPLRSERKSGQDVWYYNFHSDQTVDEFEVVFSDGAVVYAGEPQQPKAPTLKTEEEAAQILEKEIKGTTPKPTPNYKEIKEDGSF